MKSSVVVLSLFLALLPAVASSQVRQPARPAVPAFDRSSLDTTCAPCKDFFQFVNGTWLKNTVIPPAYTSWGSFSELDDRNKTVLHSLLDDAAAKPGAPGTNRYKVGTFYASCMDTARAEADGPRPLADELNRIATTQTPVDVQAEVARLHALGVGVAFGFGARQDFKNSTQFIASIDQGGLGLPDRDYYTKTDSASIKLKTQYQQHVMRTLMLLGDPPSVAEFESQRIVLLETALARASMDRVARRNPDSVYHKMTVADLKALTPSIDWSTYFASAGLPALTDLNVAAPNFLKMADSVIAKTSILTGAPTCGGTWSRRFPLGSAPRS